MLPRARLPFVHAAALHACMLPCCGAGTMGRAVRGGRGKQRSYHRHANDVWTTRYWRASRERGNDLLAEQLQRPLCLL